MFERHAFLYSNGTMIDLGTLGSATGEQSRANDINDAGQIVGSSVIGNTTTPFLYANGKMVGVGTLIDPKLQWTVVSAEAINNKGQIVGSAYTGDPEPHAILLTPPR